MLELPLITPN